MDIYNKDKTQKIIHTDYEKGYLKDDRLYIRTKPATEAVQEQGHYITIKEYPNGGKDVEWIVDAVGVEAKPAEAIYKDIKVFAPHTKEKLRDMQIAHSKPSLSKSKKT